MDREEKYCFDFDLTLNVNIYEISIFRQMLCVYT